MDGGNCVTSLTNVASNKLAVFVVVLSDVKRSRQSGKATANSLSEFASIVDDGVVHQVVREAQMRPAQQMMVVETGDGRKILVPCITTPQGHDDDVMDSDDVEPQQQQPGETGSQHGRLPAI